MRLRAILFAGIGLAGCAHRRPDTPPEDVAILHHNAEAARLDAAAEAVFAELAAIDPSFLLRVADAGGANQDAPLHLAPIVLASTVDDTSTVAAHLARAKRDVSDVSVSGYGVGEKRLLEHAIAEEESSLHEAAFPRGMAERMRVLGALATRKVDLTDAERSTWLVDQLDRARDAIAPRSLTSIEAADADDALDPLEKACAHEPRVVAAITRLRIALGQLDPLPARAPNRDAFAAALTIHLGVTGAGEARRKLEEAQHRIEDQPAPRLGDRALHDAVVGIVAAIPATSWPGTATDSPVLSLGIPSVRAPIFAMLSGLDPVIRRELATEKSIHGYGRIGFVVLHDSIALGLRALAVADEGASYEDAERRYATLAPLEPHDELRLARFVMVRPVAALGVGLAASIAVNSLWVEVTESWLKLGDVPVNDAAQFIFPEPLPVLN